jgi:hypothetical protein
MDFSDDEYRDLLARMGLPEEDRVHEPMRDSHKTRNPSSDDLKVRRRNNRRTAGETFDGGDVPNRAELRAALTKAASLAEQARLLDEIAKLDNARSASAAQGREMDFTAAVVRETLSPVRVHEHHTAATDWIGYDSEIPADWQNRVIAEAAAWYSRVPDMVKADGDEYAIQAQGKARQFAGQFGIQAQAARQTFTQYVEFLRTQAASGLDQIQQTIDPNNVPKTTPLNPEVFDNFAPEVDPINAGTSGTEDSNRNPLLQEIMQGGTGMDPGAPEKPSEHDEQDNLSWNPPEGMQQDSAPPRTGSLIAAPSVAIGGYGFSMDDFRREAAAKQAGGPGKAEGGPAAAPKARRTKVKAKEAASGLDQIQQTVDPNNQPKTTPIPPEVAFPLDDEFGEEWNTNGTGTAQPTRTVGQRKQADMWGASDAPHAVPQPDVANTPATTPASADSAGSGAADANANERPTFADNSSHIPPSAQQYAQGYSGVDQVAKVPQNVPPSMASAKVSSLIVTAAERVDPEFKKGYGYASRWTPGTTLVSTGSSSFEAGLYAGISDNPENQREFIAAHASAAAKYPALGMRAAQHRSLTVRIASKNTVATNGLYLTAGTSTDLNTTAPNTTPAADGSTPINGPGRPGPLDGQQEAATPGGPAPYNGAEPFGTPVVPNGAQTPSSPADALVGGGGMSTTQQVQAAFRKRVQSGLLAERKGK